MSQASLARAGIGAFVRLARERRGLSQRKLSASIGRSPAYVSKLESDAIDPSFTALAEVMVALGLNPMETWILCRVALLDGHTCLEESAATATPIEATA